MSSYPSLQSTRVVNPILTQVAHGFRQQEFVGNLAFPPVTVEAREGVILRFNEDEFVLHEMRRAPGADILSVQGGWGSDDYELFQDAIQEQLPIEHIEEAQQLSLNLQQRSVQKAMRRIALRLEFDQLSLLGDQTQYPTNNTLALSGTDLVSDPASNIEAYFQLAHEAVLDGCGLTANTMILSLGVFFALQRHPLMRDKIKYTSASVITLDQIAAAFNIRRAAIASAKYKLPNSDEKLPMFDNRLWIGYVPENGEPILGSPLPPVESNIDQPSFGYTYTLEGYPVAEEPYYQRNNRTWYFPVIAERRPVLTGMGAGFLFTNVI